MTTNRLSEAQNREIARWLKICRHEHVVCNDWLVKNNKMLCGKCNQWHYINPADLSFKDNIPFDSREGFWLIMDHGPKNEKWGKFVQTHPTVFKYHFSAVYEDGLDWAIKQEFIGPQLAHKLIKFIE